MPLRLRLELGEWGRGRRRGSRGRQGQVRTGSAVLCGQWGEPGRKVRCVCWTRRGCDSWSERKKALGQGQDGRIVGPKGLQGPSGHPEL